MTLTQFIKKLETIKKKHGGRLHIQICPEQLAHNPDYSHCDVNDINVEVINWAIDDNVELADGSERQRRVVTLT